MANTYFQYLDLMELQRKFKSVYDKIEEQEGVLDEEIEALLYEVESDQELLANDVINLINGLEDTKPGREREIKRLKDKNASVDIQVEFLKKFLQDIVKSKGIANKSGNSNMKFNDYSLTVGVKKSFELTPEFSDKRFIRTVFKDKIPEVEANMITAYLKKRLNIEPTTEEVILKAELNAECKANGLVDGVVEKEKEFLTIR